MKPARSHSLHQLNKILNYGWAAAILVGVGFVASPGFILQITWLFAVVFIPYMSYLLWKAGRRDWVLYLAATLTAAYIPSLFRTGSSMLNYLFGTLPLVAFFFYVWVLNLQLKSWIAEDEFELETAVEELKNKKRDH